MGIYMVTYEHMCCVLKEFWPNETTKNEAIPKQIQMVSGGMAGNCNIAWFRTIINCLCITAINVHGNL